MDELWISGRDIIKEEAEEHLGRRKSRKQQWITDEILTKCDERRQAKKDKNQNPTQTTKKITYV